MKVSLDGTASTFAVLPPGTAQGVTTDPQGNLYVLLNTVLGQPSNVGQLWRISRDGTTQTLLAAVNARDLNGLSTAAGRSIYGYTTPCLHPTPTRRPAAFILLTLARTA